MGAVMMVFSSFSCSSCVWNPSNNSGVGTTLGAAGSAQGLGEQLDPLIANHHLVSIVLGSAFISFIFQFIEPCLDSSQIPIPILICSSRQALLACAHHQGDLATKHERTSISRTSIVSFHGADALLR